MILRLWKRPTGIADPAKAGANPLLVLAADALSTRFFIRPPARQHGRHTLLIQISSQPPRTWARPPGRAIERKVVGLCGILPV